MYAHTEENTEQLQGFVCVHLYPVLVWSNTNPATVLYTSSVCAYIYILSWSGADIDVRTHGGTYRTVAGLVLLQIKTGYRCTHTRRNIQNSCRACTCNCSVCASVCAYIYNLSWSGEIQTLQLFCILPPCVLTSISCLGLEQCKPCNCSVCSSVCAYLLQIKTGYRCTHTRRNIQNSCRVCIAPDQDRI
jgi:hypothetical protein